MPDQPRPVWIHPGDIAKLRGLADSFPVVGRVVDAWDAAPADPTEAVSEALTAWSTDVERANAVLRALGMPS